MFTLKFKTGNDAFYNNAIEEIARILTEISEKVKHGKVNGYVLDYNGNKIGEYIFDQEL